MRTFIRIAFLCCIATMLYAQTPAKQPRFALEITQDEFPARYQIVPEWGNVSLSTFVGPFLHALPGPGAGDTEQPKPSAVVLFCSVEGNAVVINAAVAFGAVDQRDPSVLPQGSPQQKFGTYSLHLNESVDLEEMEQLGLRPWSIKIVNAQLAAAATLPIANNVPSIEPEILGKDREGYRIALRNISSRAVTAIAVETTPDHSNRYSESNDRGSLITPGESLEFRVPCDTSASATPSGTMPNPASCVFNLEAALFADNSFEGDASHAAELAARRVASQFQIKRVRELVDNIVADSSLNDTAKLARIRGELPNLPEEPDPSLVEQIRDRFPGLSSADWSSLSTVMQSALAAEKQNALRALKEFENLPKQSPSSMSLAQWWSAREGSE